MKDIYILIIFVLVGLIIVGILLHTDIIQGQETEPVAPYTVLGQGYSLAEFYTLKTELIAVMDSKDRPTIKQSKQWLEVINLTCPEIRLTDIRGNVVEKLNEYLKNGCK